MITSSFNSNKVTANQYAKQQILDALDSRACGLLDYCDGMTEKEQQAVMDAYQRQLERVAKLLGGFETVYNFGN